MLFSRRKKITLTLSNGMDSATGIISSGESQRGEMPVAHRIKALDIVIEREERERGST